MNKTLYLCLVFLFFFLTTARSQVTFSDYFEPKSLRFDFTLAGNQNEQRAYMLGLSEEPHWAGPVKNLIEPFNYGDYRVAVFDSIQGKLLYTRGFNTLFREWRTTEEAHSVDKAYTHSITVPYPQKTIRLVMETRNFGNGKWEPLFQMHVNPRSIFIDHSPLPENKVTMIRQSGKPEEKVDLVILAEGYTLAEQEKFLKDTRRLCDSLFSFAPFDKHIQDFNIYAVGLVSTNSGTDYPGTGQWSETALNSGFWTFDSERYHTIADYLPIRNAVWNVPCDAIIVLTNSSKYGGGGIYNFYAISTVDHALSARVTAHEFGHSFAGLGDEYFDSSTSYDDSFYSLKVEPWEPNITIRVDFGSKWKDMVDAGQAGVFEGGGYKAKGIYRPQDRCMMRDNSLFCPVCQRAVERMIDYLCDRKISR